MTDKVEVVEDVTAPESSAEEVNDDLDKPIYTKRDMSAKIQHERQRALEKGRKEALTELEQQQNAQPAVQPAGLSPEQVEQMVQNALKKQIQAAETDYTVQTLQQKLEAAKDQFPNVMNDINELEMNPVVARVIKEATKHTHTAEMLHEILNNGSKFSHFMNFASTQPKKLAAEMLTLNASIESNKKASVNAATGVAAQPINQLTPSHQAVINDNGEVSISQLRKDPRLRG